MLSVNNYSREYIDACRKKIETQLTAYNDLLSTADSHLKNHKEQHKIIDYFEHIFLGNLVIVLESFFVNRMRAMEGKDGNPLNEVRVIANSIMNNDGVLIIDKSMKWNATQSVLKYKAGDTIKLNQSDFTALASEFFDEIEKKFTKK